MTQPQWYVDIPFLQVVADLLEQEKQHTYSLMYIGIPLRVPSWRGCFQLSLISHTS